MACSISLYSVGFGGAFLMPALLFVALLDWLQVSGFYPFLVPSRATVSFVLRGMCCSVYIAERYAQTGL
jgi:hypothetical protein